jgi:hypothetical protein
MIGARDTVNSEREGLFTANNAIEIFIGCFVAVRDDI